MKAEDLVLKPVTISFEGTLTPEGVEVFKAAIEEFERVQRIQEQARNN